MSATIAGLNRLIVKPISTEEKKTEGGIILTGASDVGAVECEVLVASGFAAFAGRRLEEADDIFDILPNVGDIVSIARVADEQGNQRLAGYQMNAEDHTICITYEDVLTFRRADK